LDLVGFEKEELLEKRLYELTPEKWHALEHQIIDEQVLVRGYSDVFQKELCRKDGAIVPVELRIVLTRDSDHQPIGMWAIVRDVTGRIAREEKLRWFQHSVESSPDAVFWLNAKGRFPYVNAQACRSLGYSREELMQLHLWDIDADFSREQWGPHWKAVGQAGGARLERRHRRKDGTVFPVEISSSQVVLNRQKHHVAYARDISRRKKTFEALRFFKHAIDTSPDGVFQMPEDGGFSYVNDQACRSLGYTREELLKMHLWDIDPDFTPERWRAHWEDMRTARSRLIETAHRRKDG
jgi:PAS domain S-box-containing protein